ncbi:hypothetical protein LCGC14_0246150 [marine sediment metagenome]|uniref:Uncharacterized protein n=1 Tax=marine sediment metagenome TaxID=412755 RepID=A0A0F9UAN6_9ZZZZ
MERVRLEQFIRMWLKDNGVESVHYQDLVQQGFDSSIDLQINARQLLLLTEAVLEENESNTNTG